MQHRLLWASACAAGGGVAWYSLQPTNAVVSSHFGLNYLVPEARSESVPKTRIDYLDKVPSRAEQLRKLADGTAHNPFDVLIVGGGATGTGCALDAVTRYVS